MNSWYMHNDPAVYEEPRAFRPERWEGKLQDAKEDSVGARSELFTFGAGRRICPGQHLAERNLFLTISKILWTFDISSAKDENGDAIPIDMEQFTTGGVISLAPFRCSIKPRTAEHASFIQKEWEDGRAEFLDEEEQWKRVPQGVEKLMENIKK